MNHSNKLEELYALGMDKSVPHDERVRALIDWDSIYQSCNIDMMSKLERTAYLVYRELGTLYYETNRNASECIRYFDKAFNLFDRGDYDSEINLCISKGFYCKSLILEGLKTGDTHLFARAGEILKRIRLPLAKEGRTVDTYNASALISAVNAIQSDDLWTVVVFDAPYRISLGPEDEYAFKYNGIKCKIKANLIQSPRGNFIECDNCNIYIPKDRFGLFN